MNNLLSGCRVLVVEDEMMVLMNIEAALGDLGCAAIFAAPTVDRALALVEAKRFDVAILDVNLGASDQTSYRVADALALRSIPFVFSTGYSDKSIDARFLDRPVLQKPYLDEELGAALAGLLPAFALTPPSA
ncbi:MAG TPA: response regulator [Novosphingobium sp.]|nr:response regulator [Novosphingobium sp.]